MSDNKNNQGNPPRKTYDGVVYEPSRAAREKLAQDSWENSTIRLDGRPPGERHREPERPTRPRDERYREPERPARSDSERYHEPDRTARMDSGRYRDPERSARADVERYPDPARKSRTDDEHYYDTYRTARTSDEHLRDPDKATRTVREYYGADKPVRSGRSSGARRPSNAQAARRKQKPQKSQFAIFYIATLFTGVVICIVIFAVVFNSISNSRTKTTTQTTPTPGPTDVAIQEINQFTGVIQNVDSATQDIRILNIETSKTYELSVSGSSLLNDKYGQAIVFAELSVGSIVDVGFDVRSNILTQLTVSPQAWEMKLIKDVKVAIEERSITLGNDTYHYDGSTIVEYDGKPYEIRNIKPIDVLTITGYKDKVWHIVVNKSHGVITFINAEKINDGILEIDTSIYTQLENAEPVTLLEGAHRVVVKGVNIEPFSKDVIIKPGETLEIDLEEVQILSGMLNVRVNESGYRLYIDEEEVSTEEPAVLTYGDYKVRVEKDDFEPWEQNIVLNEPLREINVEITRIIKSAKLIIYTYPEGANVYVDGGLVGISPIDVMVEYGDHTITVRKDGFVDTNLRESIEKSEHIYNITLYESANALPAPDNADSTQNETPAPTVNWED